MISRLEGQVALVTGGGQGIGRGIAHALAREGAAVIVTGRTAATLDAVRDEVLGLGAAAIAVVGDVSRRADVAAMVDAAIECFGRLDFLINNAQSTSQQLLENLSDEDIELSYRTGTLGTVYAMQAALPHLKVRGGAIVNFGSSAAVSGDPTFASYTMAKEAIRGLTRVAAREWGSYGIRVNCVCPTSLTPAAQAFGEANPEQFAGYLSQIPLGRMGDPERDIGRAVATLVSEDMAYLTGATLMLNGGRVLVA